MTAVGETLDGVEVDYYIDGKCTKKNVPYSLRHCFSNLVDRIAQPQNLMFQSLIYCYWS